MDLDRDILARMDFVPIMEQPPRLMDARIFRPELMGIRRELIDIPLDERLSFDPRENLFFVNFERLAINSEADIAAVHTAVTDRLAPLGHPVNAVVNYDHFSIRHDLEDAYVAMVADLCERYYASVTRYTTSTFLRLKLGSALARRQVAPHIYESEAEARAGLHDGKV